MNEYEFKNSLLNPDWVKNNAEELFNIFWGDMSKIFPQVPQEGLTELEHLLKITFFSAYESALNDFVLKVMKDNVHEVALAIDELSKLTVKIKKKGE